MHDAYCAHSSFLSSSYHCKAGKLRYLPLHPVALERIHAYLEASGHHQEDAAAPLFMPLRGRKTGAGVSAEGI